MRVLITGRTGQVGSAVARELRGRVETITTRRGDLDLSSPDAIRAFLSETRPDLVINAAAYTAVDRAEGEPDVALAVNARAIGVLGEAAAIRGIAVVHYSTDYVFDGRLGRPATEDDAPAPQGVYGRTKRLGETALSSSGAAHLAFRVGWVYSARPGNFLTTMLRLMGENEVLRVVGDERGAPTWSRDIARATVAVLEKMAGPVTAWTGHGLREALAERGGLYHLAPEGDTTWHGFAEEIRTRAVEHGLSPLRVREIDPITAAEWAAEAPRPPDSRLCADRLAHAIGVRLRDWREGVSDCVAEYAASAVPEPMARL